MAQVRHYKLVVQVSYEASTGLSYHEIVKLVEDKLSPALKAGGVDQPENGKIISVEVTDATIGPNPARGGLR
jgi:hypothetical protein